MLQGIRAGRVQGDRVSAAPATLKTVAVEVKITIAEWTDAPDAGVDIRETLTKLRRERVSGLERWRVERERRIAKGVCAASAQLDVGVRAAEPSARRIVGR